MFRRKAISIAAVISLSTSSPLIYSLGLGNHSSMGIINRPLNIELPLIGESFELHDLKANLADDQQHEKFGLPFPTWLPKLNFEVNNSLQGPVLKVATYQAIKEPIVNFVLEIKYKDVVWFKEITLFLDPVEIVNARIAATTLLVPEKAEITKPIKVTQKVKASSADKSPTSFRVERGQSLWIIAKNWQIENVNLQQKMQAIFLSNQDAFINGDKNKLKQGALINLSTHAFTLLNNTQVKSETKTLENKSLIEKEITSQTQTNGFLISNVSQPQSNNQPGNNNQIESELSVLKDTISQQKILNLTLKAELERLEQQIELKQQLILAQNRAVEILTSLNKLPDISQINQTKKLTSVSIDETAIPTVSTNSFPQNNLKIPLLVNTNNLADSEESNNIKSNSPFNLWLTAIWFGIAIIIAYLGTIISNKRNAKKFAKRLDNKLQGLAYNKRKQLDHTPTIRELSIPQNLAPSVQIKYLNSAADFYIRCHRHDLAKELVNEGLLQFRGNAQIIDTLNQIRKRIFNHLDNDIHAHIVEKLDARVAQAREENKIKDDNIIDIDDFNKEWLKKWDKKVS